MWYHKFCSTCGAAISIVSSLGQDRVVERICAMSVRRGQKEVDIVLLARAQPINIAGKRFLLLFLQDITKQQQRAALERTFFHDINNMLGMLVGGSELLVQENPSELAQNVYQASLRLYKEIAIQRCLSQSETYNYQLKKHDITTKKIFSELQSFFANHPAGQKKKIEFQKNYPKFTVNTDTSLLLRVLCNMLINALEATEKNGVVKIWIEHEGTILSFSVWNSQAISQEIANRIFQRNFSTKEDAGRGTGTFSMKLFGEKLLGGKINFNTSQEEGTVFKFSLPLY